MRRVLTMAHVGIDFRSACGMEVCVKDMDAFRIHSSRTPLPAQTKR